MQIEHEKNNVDALLKCLLLFFLSFYFLFLAIESSASSLLPQTLRERLRSSLEALEKPQQGHDSSRLYSLKALNLFYERNGFQPIWLDHGLVVQGANELLGALEDARKEGLRPDDYHLEEIKRKLADWKGSLLPGDSDSIDQLIELELLLSDAFLLYGSHLLAGRINPESIDPEWSANRRGMDMSLVLESAVLRGEIKNTLAQLAPGQEGYKHLRNALEFYRNLETTWDFSGFSGRRVLKKGFVGTENTELRKRLAAEGFLPERIENENGMFDDELEQAVRRYQLRYGLDADGVVGPRTLSSLAVSIEERTLQIVMNMERWRWLPQTLGKRHVMVNIADFRLEAVDDGTRVLEMKAIVGKGYRRTPVFSDQIRYLVLNPTWNIPPSIAVKDKLPLIKEDPSYLKVQKIRVFKGLGADMQEIEGDSIDWSTVKARGFPYSLRQDPGPHNALGRIKFMFPNKYNVYLHDTPSRELFGKSSRSFSSGCVRIEKPVELAAYFLLRNTQWSYEAIQGAIDKGTEQTIKLGQPVPVHLLYWTAFPDDSGSIQFRPDIYGRDLLLKEAWLSATPPADNPLQ